MWFSINRSGTGVRSAPDEGSKRGFGMDDSQINRIFEERYGNIPLEVGKKLYKYYAVAAEFGYESPEAKNYLKEHGDYHPLFLDVAEGLKLMHEDWRQKMGGPRKPPQSGYERG